MVTSASQQHDALARGPHRRPEDLLPPAPIVCQRRTCAPQPLTPSRPLVDARSRVSADAGGRSATARLRRMHQEQRSQTRTAEHASSSPGGHLLHEVERIEWEIAQRTAVATWPARRRRVVLRTCPRGPRPSGAGRQRRPGPPIDAGRSSARAPEERQRPAWPRARSAQRGRVQRTRGYRVRLYV